MTTPTPDPFYAYGRVLGALHQGMMSAVGSMLAGFHGWHAPLHNGTPTEVV